MQYLKKLIVKILTNKKMRNTVALSAFLATAVSVGNPWGV